MKITLRQYYFFAIWLPIIVPAIIWLMFYFNLYNFDFAADIVMFAPILYVLQYISFLAFAFYKHRKSNTKTLRKFSFVAPIYFIPFELIGIFIACLFDNRIVKFEYFLNMIEITIMFVIPVLAFGYFYVALAHGLGFILQKIGFIKPEQPSIISGNE